MSCIKTLHTTAVCLGLALAGCSGSTPAPTKELKIAGGGVPVLTTEECEAQKKLAKNATPTTLVSAAGVPPGNSQVVAPASFAEPATMPHPLQPLEYWSEQDAAADALGRIGSAAVPDLIAALGSNDPTARLKATEVLGRMGAEAQPAVPQLTRLLDDPDVAVRKAAARALGQIGPAAKDAVPALMRTLLLPSPANP